jgi:hypothetical protein
MIGGNDIVFSKHTEPLDRIVLVQAFQRSWPALVVQDGTAEDIVSFDDALGIVASADEFFVYRDEPSFKSWSEHGARSDNEDQMVHVMVGPEEVTFVVAGSDSETYTMAQHAIIALSSTANQDISELLVASHPPVVADEPRSKDRVVSNGSRLSPREELAA